MNIVVTGGSGTIGSFVASECRRRAHDITVFDIEPPADPDLDYTNGDITDRADVDEAVSKADAVVHMASLLPPACQADPRRAERINVGGTLNVLEGVSDQTRLIVVSSKAVFGPISGPHTHPIYEPLGESAPKTPTTVYGVTKLACERYCGQYKNRGADVAAVRFASTYGPGKGDQHGDRAVIPHAIERAARGEDVQLNGGDQRNDLVYFGDVARGYAMRSRRKNSTTSSIISDRVAHR